MRRRQTRGRAPWLAALVPLAVGCNSIFGISPGTTGSGSTATGTGGATSSVASGSATGTGGATSSSATAGGSTVATSSSGAGGSTGAGGAGSSTAASGSGGAAPTMFLLAPTGGPSTVPDGTTPFETDTVSLTRPSASTHFVLSSMPDGTGTLYVDDNIHVVVTPTVGSAADQYYEFWSGYPCPAASTTMPPGGSGSGLSPPIDVSFLFSADTTSAQVVTLEFWHCASHVPAPHSDFYLVEL